MFNTCFLLYFRSPCKKLCYLQCTYLFFAGLPVALILLEPDNGTSMAYIMAILFILFASGIDRKYILVACILIAIAVPIIYNNLPDYAINRIKVVIK